MITRENYEIWMLDYVEGKLNSAQRNLFFEFLAQNPDLKKQFDGFDNSSIEKTFVTETPSFNLKKQRSWLLEKYTEDELVFNVCENLLNPEELREWNELVKAQPQLLDKVIRGNQLVLKPVEEQFDEKLLLKKSDGNYLITTENCSTYFLLYADTKELALYKAIQPFLIANPKYASDFEWSQRLVLKPDARVVFENKESLKKKERRVVGFYWWGAVAAAACILLVALFFYPGSEKRPASYAGIVDSVKANVTGNATENTNVPEEATANNSKITNNQTVASNGTQQLNHKNKVKQEKKENVVENEKIVPDNKIAVNNNNGVRHENKNQENKIDSTKQIIPVTENNNASLANNASKTVKNDKGLNPLDAVAKVINNKYYENETPKEKEASAFYAMKNMVNSASGGNADISKKEDADYKEFGFKIGDFKFSRKKNKNKAKED
ncbi:MAG TPA: hypothetical protein VD905_03025 [Flavobacteriales bacterium]|nr:hypothetical protein [Flavobacteriales bacterium]